MQAPVSLPSEAGAFLKIDVAAVDPARTSWAIPLSVYFRRADGGWKLVGLERLPDGGPTKK